MKKAITPRGDARRKVLLFSFIIFSFFLFMNFSSADYYGCGKVDIVFVADISKSMTQEWRDLQYNMFRLEEYYRGDGCYDVSSEFYHLKRADYTGKTGGELMSGKSFWDWTLETDSGYCRECFISGKNKAGDSYRPKASSEAWGLGVIDLINDFGWRENSTRMLIFYADNYPTGGNRRNFQIYDIAVAERVNFEARKKGIQVFGFTKNLEASSSNLYGDSKKNDAYELMELAVRGIGKIYAYEEASNLFPSKVMSAIKSAPLTCGYNNLGECRLGTRTCTHHNLTSDEWCVLSSCAGAIYPVPEISGDGKDNDCDGLVDEK